VAVSSNAAKGTVNPAKGTANPAKGTANPAKASSNPAKASKRSKSAKSAKRQKRARRQAEDHPDADRDAVVRPHQRQKLGEGTGNVNETDPGHGDGTRQGHHGPGRAGLVRLGSSGRNVHLEPENISQLLAADQEQLNRCPWLICNRFVGSNAALLPQLYHFEI
jgi:hypothetical protein